MAESNMSANMSEDFRARMLEEMNSDEMVRLVPTIVFLIVISICGIIGNGLVCHVYRTRYRLSNSQCFILCLSAIDLFSCCIVIPFEVATIFEQYNFQHLWLCKSSRVLNTLSTMSGSFLLIFISIDRYRKVCKPFGWQISSSVAKVLCVSAPLLGFLWSWPSILLYGKKTFVIRQYNITGTECSTDDSMKDTIYPFINQVAFGGLFASGMVIMIVLYCLIGREVHRHAKRTPKEYVNMKTSLPMLSATMETKESKVDGFEDSDAVILQKYVHAEKNKGSQRRRSIKEESDVSWTEKPDHSTSVDDKETNPKIKSCEANDAMEAKNKNDSTDSSSEDSGIKSEHNGKDDQNDTESGKPDRDEKVVEQILEESEREDESISEKDRNSLKDIEINEEDIVKEENDAKLNKPRFSRYGATVRGKLSSMKHRMSSVLSRMTSIRSGVGESGPDSAGKVQYLKQARARKTAFLMFLITLCFILSYMPHLLLMLIRVLSSGFVDSMSETGLAVYKFFLRSYFLNCAINPVIYGVCDSRFRAACKEIFSCCGPKDK